MAKDLNTISVNGESFNVRDTTKQEKLVSGSNIRTINGVSVLGSGNISIDMPVDASLSETSTNPVQNKAVTAELADKAPLTDFKMAMEDISAKLAKKADLTNKNQTVRMGVTHTDSVYFGDDAWPMEAKDGELYFNGDKVTIGAVVSSDVTLVQGTGQGTTAVMSQKAVTDNFAKLDDGNQRITAQNISTSGVQTDIIEVKENITISGLGKIVDSDGNSYTLPYGTNEGDYDYTIATTEDIDSAVSDKLKVQEVKGNGNIVLADGKGNTKEFMPSTPSGDPMHYQFEAMGAVWNGTGKDITYPTPWADYADADEDKVYVHKAGYWAYGYIGDLTNEDMRRINLIPRTYSPFVDFQFAGTKIRVLNNEFLAATLGNSVKNPGYENIFATEIESIILSSSLQYEYRFNNAIYAIGSNYNLKYIFGNILFETNTNIFYNDYLLRICFVKNLKTNLDISILC